MSSLIKKFFFVAFIGLSICSTLWAKDYSEDFLNTISQKYGDYATRRLLARARLMREVKNLPEKQKLVEVNNFYNLFEYRANKSYPEKANYLATPLEFTIAGTGNCEDFTIAKYFTLRELGVPDEKLLIEYVKLKSSDPQYDTAHMVLLYYETPNSIPLVLDNVNKEILPGDQRKDLIPIYGFNGLGLWEAKGLKKGEKIGRPQDLKRWSKLQEKIKSGEISDWVTKE